MGSSRLMLTEREEEADDVSRIRRRAVKICCAVGLGGAVQGPAWKPRVEVMGGMA